MDILGAFVIGLASTFLGSISTGASLISVPGIIFLGFTPVQAIATTRLSAVSGSGTTVYRYNKAGAVIWRYIPLFLIISIIAGVSGPVLLAHIPQHLTQRIVGVLLILMLPTLFLRKNFGVVNRTTSRLARAGGLISILVIMIYGTAFGIGGGTFLLYALVYFFGLTVTEANATGTVIWGLGALTALITYIHNGSVVLSIGVALVVGSALGGYLGASLALKKGTSWVKYVLAAVTIVSAVKLIV